MSDNNTSWDTEETGRIIMNDEPMYSTATRLARSAYSIGRLAQRLEGQFADIIKAYPYSEVNTDKIVWEEIAADLMEEV